MSTIDQSVINFFAANRVEWLTFVMLTVTYLGNTFMVAFLTFISAISFYFHKHYTRILPLLISVAGSTITIYLLKKIINRPRPAEIMYPEFSSSFPSFHAAAAIALYGFFLYIIWKHDKHYLKKPFMAFLFILIFLEGLSRLYLGEHYLSDVLAGYAIGLIWLFISAKLHNFLLRFEWFKTKLKNNF